jgi:hypothetical protein
MPLAAGDQPIQSMIAAKRRILGLVVDVLRLLPTARLTTERRCLEDRCSNFAPFSIVATLRAGWAGIESAGSLVQSAPAAGGGAVRAASRTART